MKSKVRVKDIVIRTWDQQKDSTYTAVQDTYYHFLLDFDKMEALLVGVLNEWEDKDSLPVSCWDFLSAVSFNWNNPLNINYAEVCLIVNDLEFKVDKVDFTMCKEKIDVVYLHGQHLLDIIDSRFMTRGIHRVY